MQWQSDCSSATIAMQQWRLQWCSNCDGAVMAVCEMVQ